MDSPDIDNEIKGSDPHELPADDKPSRLPPSESNPPPRARGVSVAQAALVWGPFHLPSLIGIINNSYACVYMVFVVFWSVWPPATPVSTESMNYSVVVTGGVIIFAMIWYFVRAKKTYHGPTVDDEVETVMRRGSVISV